MCPHHIHKIFFMVPSIYPTYIILDSSVITALSKQALLIKRLHARLYSSGSGGKLLICLRAKISPSQTELNQSLKSESLLKVKLNPRHLLIYRAINEG